MNLNPAYNQDFYTWVLYTAQLLKEGKFSEIDSQRAAEELESMGFREKRELISWLAVLIAHLLKWSYELDKRSNSRKYTIEEHRQCIMDILEDSPSLKHQIQVKFDHAYNRAVTIAAKETGFHKSLFPQPCPYTPDQILDDGFYPE